MKNKYLIKFMLCLMVILTLNSISFATSIDTMPPKGELVIENATLKNGKYYTSEKELILNIKITDNKPITSNYKMLISNKPVTGEELANSSSWIPYKEKVNWTLDSEVGAATRIYVYLKDEAGNVSPNVVETTKKFTITYVAQGATNVPAAQTAICGMPFTTSAKEPKMANKHFMGWSLVNGATTESWVAEDVIEPKYISSDATLYAVWADAPRKASEAVEVGDFVEYPVQYENVNTNNGKNASTLTGWRVLDITDGVIKLISTGTPLAYNKSGTNENAIDTLTTNFLNGTSLTYESYGFTKSLRETFNNPYTEKVESIKASDVTKLTGSTVLNNLDISSYGGTLTNVTYYYIAGEADSSNIYYVNGDLEIIESTTGKVYGVRPVVTLSSLVITKGKNAAGKWKIAMPSVTITLNDGTSTSNKTVTLGDKIGDLPIPTKTGYTFNGWYNQNNERVTKDTVVTENAGITLTAKWTVETYTVTFDPNGGTIEGVGSTSTTRVVTYGSTYGAATLGLPVATMVGYNFAGWFTAKTGGEQITESTTVGTSAKNLILYARWEEISEPQAIAIYSDTDKSLTFLYITNIPEVGSTYDGKVVTEVYTGIETTEYYANIETQELNLPGWQLTSVPQMTEKVIFKDKITPISTAAWFTSFEKITSIDFSNLDTTNVTDMSYMFAMASSLSSLDLSNFNTSNVTNMSYMFTGKNQYVDGTMKITEIDLSSFDTKNVTNMKYMFANCKFIPELDLSKFDTTNVATMESMFDGCEKLQQISLSDKFAFIGTNGYLPAPSSTNITGADGNWYNTATGMSYTPEQIPNNTAATYSALPRYTVTFDSNGGTIEGVGDTTTTRIVAYGSTYGEAIVGFPTARKSGFKFLGWFTAQENGEQVTEATVVTEAAKNQNLYAQWEEVPMEAMAIFSETDYSLTFLRSESAPEIGSIYNEKLVSAVFEGIEYIPYEIVMADILEIDEENSIMPEWSDLAEDILRVDFKDKISPISTAGWFMNMINIKKLNLSYLDTSNVTSMSRMFYMCYDLTKLDLSHFDTSKVTNMSTLFGDYMSFLAGAYAEKYMQLQELDITGWDTSNVTNMSWMFAGCMYLPQLDLSHIDTSSATDMMGMFCYDMSLIEIDLSNFDTTNVTNMAGMFMGTMLNKIDLSNFETANVIAMDQMFAMNQVLSQLDLSNFDTTSVTSMNGMFMDSQLLMEINLSSFDTTNVTNMAQMFSGCSALTNIDISNFNTTNVTDMGSMFLECTSLQSLDLSAFDTTNVTTMTSMFNSCSSLEEVKLGEKFAFVGTDGYLPTPSGDGTDGTWYNTYTGVTYAPEEIPNNTAAIYEATKPAIAIFSETDNSLTFLRTSEIPTVGSTYDGKKVTAIWTGIEKEQYYYDLENNEHYLPGWSASGDIITSVEIKAKISPVSTVSWFGGMTNLTSLDLSNLNTSKVTDMSMMFAESTGLTELDVSHFDTKNVTSMMGMFSMCENLTTLDVTNFDTSQVTDMMMLFTYCSKLTELDVTNFDTSNVISMSLIFAGCSGLTELDITNFDTSNVTDMMFMFAECTGLTYLDVTNFNTSNVVSMFGMFQGCTSLTEIDVRNFDTSKVVNMYVMFDSCSSLTKLDLSSFDTSSVTDMPSFLANCDKLQEIKLGDKFARMGIGPFFPTPSSEHIPGADGKWYNTKTLQGYAPNYVPNNTAATYVAVKPLDEAIAIFSETDNSLIFTRVNEVPAVGSTYNEKVVTAVYTGIEDEDYYYIYDYADDREYADPSVNLPAWIVDGNASKVIKVEFLDRITPNSTAGWFASMTNLTNVDFSKLDTSHVTNMSAMFMMTAITELDLTTFDTKNVTDMGWMFAGCSELANIDLSSFNTSKVTNMRFMFGAPEEDFGNEVLTKLDLSSFDTSNVTDMSYMFAWQGALKTIDLTSFDTSNVTDMSFMFCWCFSLTTLDDTEYVEEEREPLLLGDVNFDGAITEDDAYLIYDYTMGDAELTEDQKLVADVNQDGIVNMSDAYIIALNPEKDYGYVSFEKNNILNFDTTNVTNMNAMFMVCWSLTNLDVTSFNTSNVTSMLGMFYLTSIKKLDLSNFDTSNVTTMEMMLYVSDIKELKVGEKFKFIEGQDILVAPSSSTTTPGADGKWYNIETGEAYSPTAMPSYVNATYSAIPMYKVTFIANGGTIEDLGSTSTTRIVEFGKNYGSGDAGFPVAERFNYKCIGWYTAQEGGELVTAETLVDTTASGLVLYAHWELLAKYEVTFDANGGTISDTGGTTTTRIVTETYIYKITEGGFPAATLVDYSFDGWFTEAEGGTQITEDTVVDSTADGLILYAHWSESCFAEGTLITLADGTQKPIEEITYEDELLVWDFYNGGYTVSTASAIETGEVINHEVITLCFSDGTEVRIVDQHGFYDEAENDFVFIDSNNVSSYIGHNFIKLSDNNTYKSVKLTDYYLTTEDVKFYTMLTAVHNNCIAEGMFTLTAEPMGLIGWYDTFEIGDDMKYDEKLMQETIEEYGLYTYEDFEEYVTYEQFIAFNGPYLKIVVGKGYITYEQILQVINRFANIMAQ